MSVVGKIGMDQYTTKDGENRAAITLVVDDMELLSRKNENASDSEKTAKTSESNIHEYIPVDMSEELPF